MTKEQSLWQVDFAGGANCHFDHYPTTEEIAKHLKIIKYWNKEIAKDHMNLVVESVGNCRL